MSHCKDCEYWAKNEEVRDDNLKMCYRILDVGALFQIEGEPFSGVSLVTSPDFGCVQFAPRAHD
jgi:hypothetical protein